MTKWHADHYADEMVQIDAAIEANDLIAEQTYRLRVSVPPIAAAALPGQFVMIRLQGRDAPLIGRALAIYEVVLDPLGEPTWIDLIYLRKGAMTSALAAAPLGTSVTVWGPLGNRFSDQPCDRLIMAAGGIGQTPMLMLGQQASGVQHFGGEAQSSGWARSVELIYGARRASLLAGVDDFRRAGIDVSLCTDDGSAGSAALVPQLVAERLSEIAGHERARVVTCGPEIMMEKVAEVCRESGVPCQVSMETPMACGIGICFSCVARVREPLAPGRESGDPEWDYKRTCVEGPIFDSERICWR